MRQTSLDAYFNEVKPKLSRTQLLVLEALEEIAPANDKQIAAYLNWPINSVTPRRGELLKKKQVTVAYVGKDTSGRSTTFWKPKDMQDEFTDTD
jgi:DNA-binding MarR family transcriptional regulator